MSHVMFGGLTHARRSGWPPPGGDHPDGSSTFPLRLGSVGVEVAIKMALQAQHARGRPSGTGGHLARGYHGDTFNR